MRDYQVQGLNWMVSLYHNGINGILADEMVRSLSLSFDQPVDDGLIPQTFVSLLIGTWKDAPNDLVLGFPQVPPGYQRTSPDRRSQVDPSELGPRGSQMGSWLQDRSIARNQRREGGFLSRF